MLRRPTVYVFQWLSQFVTDMKDSTDASLLGVARFLGLLYGPIDRRLRIDQAWRKAMSYRLPSYVGWRHAFGGITYLLFIVLVVTGVLLAFYYRPSAQEAYPSVQHIVSDISFGWLVRDVHVWAANLIVLATLAHMARVFFSAAYKPPRETNWLIGLLLLFVVLAFGATGYLLPWDQWAYWTVTEVLGAVNVIPVIGTALGDALMGDVIASGATLSRYFALHVIVLPWIAFALLVYHFVLVRRRGIAPPVGVEVEKEGSFPFFPNHLLRSFIVSVLVLALLFSLAALYPRPIGAPADPFAVPDELVSTWVPVDVSLALIHFFGNWGLALFTLLGLSLVLIPLFDRTPKRRMRQRPIVTALGLLFFTGFFAAWLAGRQLRGVRPSAHPQTEVLEERGFQPTSRTPLPEIGPTPIQPAPPDSLRGRQP
jgi:quinol-cytochrome oxidoreductase complex cytochrome b subunit